VNSRILGCLAALVTLVPAPGLAIEQPEKAAPQGVPPAREPEPAADEARWGARPPPGSPEDQALWRAGLDVSRRVTLERLHANKMQWQLRQGRHEIRLEALAKKAGAPEARRATEILELYRRIAPHNHQTLTRQWPIDPTRGCQYQVMHLEGVLESPEHKRKASQLLVVREELRDCVDRALPAIEAMAASNKDMERLIVEAEAFLPPLPKAGASAATGPASPDVPATGGRPPAPVPGN
jgi:hypothetical protein